MKDALGLVEIRGMSTAVVAADTMVKAANVRIIEMENTRGLGYMTIKIAGDVGAVTAAVDAGKKIGIMYDKLVSAKVIPRPADGMAKVFCEEKKEEQKEEKQQKEKEDNKPVKKQTRQAKPKAEQVKKPVRRQTKTRQAKPKQAEEKETQTSLPVEAKAEIKEKAKEEIITKMPVEEKTQIIPVQKSEGENTEQQAKQQPEQTSLSDDSKHSEKQITDLKEDK